MKSATCRWQSRLAPPGPVDPDLPDHAPEMMDQLFGRPEPDWTDRDSMVNYMTGSVRLMSGSRGFDEQDVRAAAGSVFDRAGRTAKAQRASRLGEGCSTQLGIRTTKHPSRIPIGLRTAGRRGHPGRGRAL
jgi:hypothetical protein